MPDIATIWDAQNVRGDWSVADGQLAIGQDLATAVLLSLFTDAEAHADDAIPDGTTWRRGWYGDDGETVRLGSRLWLLERSKVTADLVPRAKGYIAEALQWMIDDGVVASFSIDVQLNAPNYLAAKIVANRQDGTTVAMNFQWAWQQSAAPAPIYLTDDSGRVLTDDSGQRLTE